MAAGSTSRVSCTNSGATSWPFWLPEAPPGRVLEEMLDEVGVPRRSVQIRGRTRVSLNMQDLSTGLEFRFVPEGPTLSESEFAAFLDASPPPRATG